MKKVVKFFLIYGMLLGSLWLLFISIYTNNYSSIGSIIMIPPVLLIPYIFKKLFKIDISFELEIAFYIFIFLAQFLGSSVGLYHKIGWFDNFTHFLSGIFTCYIAVFILNAFKKNLKSDIVFNIIFIIGIVFTIACGWEFIEFTIDNVLNKDTQHVLDTGVDDTMIDMLLAFSAAIIFNTLYGLETKCKKNGLITKTINTLIIKKH